MMLFSALGCCLLGRSYESVHYLGLDGVRTVWAGLYIANQWSDASGHLHGILFLVIAHELVEGVRGISCLDAAVC